MAPPEKKFPCVPQTLFAWISAPLKSGLFVRKPQAKKKGILAKANIIEKADDLSSKSGRERNRGKLLELLQKEEVNQKGNPKFPLVSADPPFPKLLYTNKFILTL